MANTTVGLDNINFMTEAQFQSVTPVNGELYAVQLGKDNVAELGTVPSSNRTPLHLPAQDKNNDEMGSFRIRQTDDGAVRVELQAINKVDDGSMYAGELGVLVGTSGSIYAYAPTPSSEANSGAIATTEWVRDKLNAMIPDYGAGITIGTSYTAPSAGIIVAFASTGQSQSCNISVNGVAVTRFLTGHGYAEGAYTSSWVIVGEGDGVTISAGSTKTFYPYKGVI